MLAIIHRSHDPTRALVIRSALLSHGIRAEAFDSHFLGRSWWHQLALNGARVAVRAEDRAAAESLLADLEASAPDPTPMRRRPRGLAWACCLAALVLAVYGHLNIPIVLRRAIEEPEAAWAPPP